MALIFLIDDDELMLASLGKLLEVETDHRVRAFARPADALAAMAESPPDVIISDLSMPGMSGIELLRRARAIVPDGARILLTAYADKDTAIEAINDAGIYSLVEKPWNNDELLATLAHAADHVALARSLARTVAELQARNADLERTLAELRDAQDRLIATERLAAVGRLASGVAHEIGNQLSLLGYAELLADRYADDPEALAYTEPLLAARRRLGSMVSSIKEFVRGAGPPSYAREPQSLAPAVDETLSILRFEPAMKTRHVEKRPFDEGARAVVNDERMLQVVLNLVRNAIQATREDGHIRIGLERRGAEVVLEVEDDGAGIPPALLARIWEPFFSTKGDGGTGLGLGICRRIVEEHGGRIEVQSAEREGARFTVVLPAASP